MKRTVTTAWLACLLYTSGAFAQSDAGKIETYTERYRPQFHYTTQKGWINDPCGLVYFDGALSSSNCSAFFGEDFTGGLVAEAFSRAFVE